MDNHRLESNLARAAASYPDVPLLMKICAQRKAGTRKILPIVPYASLPVTRVSRLPLCSAKNEAPEEEAPQVDTAQRLAPKQIKKQNKTKNKKTLC